MTERVSTEATVCVVIPMFNAGATIVKALDSLSAQSRQPDHVVVVDDGSQDDCATMVSQYQAPYRLTLIRQANQGPAAARNAGIFAAKEALICFLDADDAWLMSKLEKQLNLYCTLTQAGHRVGIVDCFERIYYADGKTELAAIVKGGNHFSGFVIRNVINGTSCVMALRAALEEIGGFDTEIRFAEDRWLWTQVAHSYEVHTVPEILSERFIGPSNITSNPAKYYSHKERFVEKFMARYGNDLSRKQSCMFVFQNHLEFLRVFSRCGDYQNVTRAFKNMTRQDVGAYWFDRGRPLIRYLHARFMLAIGRGATVGGES